MSRGEMAERPNAGALKASEVKASGGSNPSLAAKQGIAVAIALVRFVSEAGFGRSSCE